MQRALLFVTSWLLTVATSTGCAGGGTEQTASAPTRAGSAAPAASNAAAGSAAPGPGPATPTPAPTAWQGEAPYKLTFSSFHFEIGTEVTEVDSDGRVTDVFARMENVQVKTHCARPPADDAELCAELRRSGDKEFGRVRRFRASYTLAPAALAELRTLLIAARFAQMQPLYQQPDVDDGVTHGYQLETPAGTFTTTTYSAGKASEPPELLPVLRWLRDLHATHAGDRAAAPALSAAEYRALERRGQGRAMPTPARP